MDYFSRFRRQFRLALIFILAASGLAVVAVWAMIDTYFKLSLIDQSLILSSAAIICSVAFGLMVAGYLLETPRAIWQLIVHISPGGQSVAAPQVDRLRMGRELVTNLAMQVYQLASNSQSVKQDNRKDSLTLSRNFIVNNLPLPLYIIDATDNVVFVNTAGAAYIGLPVKDIIGKNIYMVLDMSFPNENTLDSWLKKAKTSVATASMSWERVRLNVLDNHPTLLFDLAAYYNRDNPDRYETMLVLFDHTKQYSQDEQSISFVALSVHELRTPLTLLRGYIEAVQEELSDTHNSELDSFLQKMTATAQQLNAFVNNILNVARVDNDQLELKLHEEKWDDIVTSVVSNIRLRAQVRGIKLETSIQPGLPTVAVDRLSIYEVINNLIDNAIKYSGQSKVIKIDAHLTKDGLVETTIQDFGVGISPSIMPNLFTKFYRDHRNRSQVGGTGLGLYLSKAILTAHSGNIWVRSKLGEGSTFGFTLLPYARLADELKNSDNNDIVRGVHGWIKNHSLYRR